MSSYQNFSEETRIRLILGTTGSGKTYRLRQFLENEDRCICFDPGGDELLESWGVMVNTCEDAVHLARKTDKFRIRMHTVDREQFNFMCGAAMQLGGCTVVIDELALYCSSHWMPENLEKLIRLGRKPRLDLGIGGRTALIGTTQRAPDIHNFILSQAKEWYIFQMHLPQHISYLRQFIPNIDDAINLEQGECIVWSPMNKISSSAE